jgi:leucyl aminopeptidase
MDVRTVLTSLEDLASSAVEALVLLLPAERTQWALPDALARPVDEAVSAGDLALKAGKSLYFHRPAGLKAKRLLVVVTGDAAPKSLRNAFAGVVAALRQGGAKAATLAWGGQEPLTAAAAELLVRSVDEALYSYRHTKSAPAPEVTLQRLNLATDKAGQAALKEGLRRGEAIAAGIAVAREAANRPGNFCTPTWLADEAKRLAREQGLSVQVLERPALEKLGMGAFLAVAKGSDEPPKFIVLQYQGAGRKDAPTVLVGKGITFDSGGISIKGSAEMDEMKFDMGGAASVLGTFRAVAELKPKLNLVGLIPACENMPSGRAMKPGDVITSLAGKTIEVLNTDAEGRLILCDALTYAERFKPKAVIDVATLTGACIIALGHLHSGLYSPDDGLAQALLTAGQSSLDTAWRMPLDDEYDKALDSNFADMANVGPRAGGSITAAMFLKRFASTYPWAHLDVAGTAWKSGAQKGSTGRPVPLLTHYLLGTAG